MKSSLFYCNEQWRKVLKYTEIMKYNFDIWKMSLNIFKSVYPHNDLWIAMYIFCGDGTNSVDRMECLSYPK